MRTLIILLLAAVCPLAAQLREFPHDEHFDSVAVPALPAGWRTSANRLATGDFATTRSAPLSDSAAVLSTNATIEQWLETPPLDFSLWEPESLSFHERRSGTHTSGVLVEASTDGGGAYPLRLADTLSNPGSTSYVRRSMALPYALLGGARTTRIRWRIAGNGTGTTGTYRLDDVTISARARFDLRLASLTIEPPFPLSGAAVRLRATVRNDGLDPAQGFSVAFFLDRDHDMLPDESELFGAKEIPGTLPPGDSVAALFDAAGGTAGSDTLVALVVYGADQSPRNNARAVRRTTGRPPGAVVVNEIMYAPASPDPEWVELASTQEDSVDIGAWGISDRNSLSVYRFAPGPRWLPPRFFAVVTRDSARLAATHPEAIIVGIGTLPVSLFNNDSDAVVLFDHRGMAMDSVHYRARWGGTGGASLERVEASGAAAESTNWGSSLDEVGSTPGRQNYRTPLDTNASAVRLVPLYNGDSTAGVALIARNTGRTSLAALFASLYLDRNRDTAASPEELLAEAAADAPIGPGDSVIVWFAWDHPEPGEQPLIARLETAHDMRPGDNQARATVTFSYPRGALEINELMYEPADGRSEYMEYLNGGALPVDVSGWRVGPRREAGAPGSVSGAFSPRNPLVVLPGEYLVVAADSSILEVFPSAGAAGSHLVARGKALGLGNSGDTVMLFDATARAIDSLVYAPEWHNPDLEETRGRSLERMSPSVPGADARNWSTSADPSGGTPGRRNSLHAPLPPGAPAALSCSPNPFSPDGDGEEDATVIAYALSFRTGTLRARVYDALGRMVRTLAGEEPTGQSGHLLWDGRDDRRERVPMGIYIVLLEAHDAVGMSTETMKGVVVVAARL